MKKRKSLLLAGILSIALLFQFAAMPIAAAGVAAEDTGGQAAVHEPQTDGEEDGAGRDNNTAHNMEGQDEGNTAPDMNGGDTDEDSSQSPDMGGGDNTGGIADDDSGVAEPGAGGEAGDASGTQDGGQEPQTDPTTAPPLARAVPPRDIRDLLAQLLSEGAEGVSSTSILTVFQLLDDEGEIITELTTGDSFNVHVEFALPDALSAILEAGDFYTFQLPEEITATITNPDTPFPLYSPGAAEPYAYFSVSAAGAVTIVFEDGVSDLTGVKGTIDLSGVLNEGNLNGTGPTEIKVPDEQGLPPVTITVKPNTTTSIDKNGTFDKPHNPDKIIWSVDINKTLDTLTGVTIQESFPAGTTYESLVVYPLEIGLDGEVAGVGTDPVPPEQYTVDENGNVTFLDGINRAYRLVYTTGITDEAKPAAGGNVPFVNNVTMAADGMQALETSSSVTANYGKKLDKASTNYDPATQTFTWVVHYNHNETTVAQGAALVTDIFQSSGMELVNGSVVLYPVVFDDAGVESRGPALVEGQDYALAPSADGFTVTFLHDLAYAVDIEYKTSVEGILDNDQAYFNQVVDGEGNTSGTGVTADQQGIIKSITNVNRDDETIDWRILVNGNRYMMYNWSMDDRLSPGQRADLDTLVVYDETSGMELVRDTHYTVRGDGAPTFTIALLPPAYDPTDHAFTITFTGSYDPTDLGDNPNFTNTATSNWTDSEGGGHSSSDSDSYNPTSTERNNGSKSGSYNAQTKEITWTILVDYTGSGLENAYLEDEIIGNQAFVPGSGKAYHYTVKANGGTVRGAELTAQEYTQLRLVEPTDSDNHYYIYLPNVAPGDPAGQFWFEYKTTVEDEIVDGVYYNTADFYNDLTPDYPLKASVTVRNGGDLVGKDGAVGADGYVWWSITVNPSQSTIEDVVVTDIPSANQVVDMESLVVYGTNVAPNGNISINESDVLVEGDDYTATYAENANGDWELQVAFANELTRPYVIRYRVLVVTDQPSGTLELTNNVTIRGDHIEEVDDTDSGTAQINVGSGSGVIIGSLGSLVVNKTIAGTQDPLAGAVFQLYVGDPQAGGIAFRGPLATGPDGSLRVNGLPASATANLYIREIEAPPGYSISPELWAGIPVTAFVDEGEVAANPVEAENTPGEVTLVKTDETDGTLLDETAFWLYARQADGTYARYNTVEYVTDGNGELHVYGLPAGDYYFLEVAPKPGYEPDPTPLYFTVTLIEGALVDPGLAMTNTPTSVLLAKVNALDNTVALEGAVFTLQRLNPQTGEYEAYRADETFATGPDGTLLVRHLPVGSYQFTEVAAPDGYRLVTEPLRFELAVNEDGAILPLALTFANLPTQVTLLKTGEGGAPLADAEFTLELYDGASGEWTRLFEDQSLVTDANGGITLQYMLPGQYRFTEVRAPEGYSLLTAPVVFTLAADADGVIQPLTVGPVANLPSVASFRKTNPSGEGLQGAEFRLEQYVEGRWVHIRAGEVFRSDVNGLVTVAALPAGQYRFVETQAPEGYYLTDETIEFTLEADAVGVIAPVEAGVLVNTPIPAPLPEPAPEPEPEPVPPPVPAGAKTGDTARMGIWLALGLGAALPMLGVLLAKKRRRRCK